MSVISSDLHKIVLQDTYNSDLVKRTEGSTNKKEKYWVMPNTMGKMRNEKYMLTQPTFMEFMEPF